MDQLRPRPHPRVRARPCCALTLGADRWCPHGTRRPVPSRHGPGGPNPDASHAADPALSRRRLRRRCALIAGVQRVRRETAHAKAPANPAQVSDPSSRRSTSGPTASTRSGLGRLEDARRRPGHDRVQRAPDLYDWYRLGYLHARAQASHWRTAAEARQLLEPFLAPRATVPRDLALFHAAEPRPRRVARRGRPAARGADPQVPRQASFRSRALEDHTEWLGRRHGTRSAPGAPSAARLRRPGAAAPRPARAGSWRRWRREATAGDGTRARLLKASTADDAAERASRAWTARTWLDRAAPADRRRCSGESLRSHRHFDRAVALLEGARQRASGPPRRPAVLHRPHPLRRRAAMPRRRSAYLEGARRARQRQRRGRSSSSRPARCAQLAGRRRPRRATSAAGHRRAAARRPRASSALTQRAAAARQAGPLRRGRRRPAGRAAALPADPRDWWRRRWRYALALIAAGPPRGGALASWTRISRAGWRRRTCRRSSTGGPARWRSRQPGARRCAPTWTCCGGHAHALRLLRARPPRRRAARCPRRAELQEPLARARSSA